MMFFPKKDHYGYLQVIPQEYRDILPLSQDMDSQTNESGAAPVVPEPLPLFKAKDKSGWGSQHLSQNLQQSRESKLNLAPGRRYPSRQRLNAEEEPKDEQKEEQLVGSTKSESNIPVDASPHKSGHGRSVSLGVTRPTDMERSLQAIKTQSKSKIDPLPQLPEQHQRKESYESSASIEDESKNVEPDYGEDIDVDAAKSLIQTNMGLDAPLEPEPIPTPPVQPSFPDMKFTPIETFFKKTTPSSVSTGVQIGSLLSGKSALSELIGKKGSTSNIFAIKYAQFSGATDGNAVKLSLFIPFSKDGTPLHIAVKADATVEEVIGYALYEYIEQHRSPPLPEKLLKIENWNLRICEDDGEIDEDFPALDRVRRIQKFAFDQFALVETLAVDEEDFKATEKREESNLESNIVSASVFLKIHLYSTLEVKQTTTMQMPLNIPMSEVFDRICQKRKYDPKNYILKMADAKTDVPLEQTLEQLKATEFCVLKRSSGGAGDIFLRPNAETAEQEQEAKNQFINPEEYRSIYKQYYISYKHLMGRHDRVLTIDGVYIHMVASEGKAFFDMGKPTNSFHASNIISVKLVKKTASFRLVVKKRSDSDVRQYDLEAQSPQEANEICTLINYMIKASKV
ncbi:stress-activated map kinase interacting protein 1-domain-containing protein [Gorgonomyces haynaldii]|nr:stress-activated map kinase interacting protein 1-domain-containing protein [Gorgonomyces haynaldii]